MKRTIKRHSKRINKSKWQTLQDIANAYAWQKDRFLLAYAPPKAYSQYNGFRQVRNSLVKAKHNSPLQARQWKLALKDSWETLDKQWLALAVELRPMIARHPNLTESQKHYAYWILRSSERIAQLVSGVYPVPKHFKIEPDKLTQVGNYLRRVINKNKGSQPRVKSARSFTAEPETYRIFSHKGTQYIAIATLTPRQRLVIPLTGYTRIKGQVRIVLDYEKQRIEVHTAADVKIKKATGQPLAIDFGITEVATDSDGVQYGAGYGETLKAYSVKLNRKGKQRNKVHAIHKKHKKRGNKTKVKRIKKFNLGRKKLNKQRRRMKRTLACKVNASLNQLLKKQPSILVCEKLGQMRGIKKAKGFNRLVSLWSVGVIADRVEFKASVGGSHRKQVSPSYTSQLCNCCGFVHRKNRNGDKFKCRFCGMSGHSDELAALNLLNRSNDPDISLWMPKERVKAILLSRFNRRLESWEFNFNVDSVNLAILIESGLKLPTTVPGKTQDIPTKVEWIQPSMFGNPSESETAIADKSYGDKVCT